MLNVNKASVDIDSSMKQVAIDSVHAIHDSSEYHGVFVFITN